MKRGLYRIRGIDGLPDDVRVEDEGIEMPVEERLYRTRGYQPPVEDLPWQEDYARRAAQQEETSRSDPAREKAAREQARQDFLGRFRKP